MNMFKKNGGFTLVELVVVIAILAILAGVAVPAYSGYITKAKDAAVLSELSAVLTAAQAATAMTGAEVAYITVADDAAPVVNPTANITSFYNKTIDMTGTSYETGAYWTPNTGWQAGTYSAG